jgi:hypothetical protein
MKKEYELSALGIGALIAGVLSIVVAEIAIFSPNRTLQTVMLVKVFLTTFNIVLLLGLTANYFKIYSGMKTPLSRSLLMFSTALMLYAVTSSPLTHVIMGFEIISIGPFTFIPDIFVTLATVIILRESYR